MPPSEDPFRRLVQLGRPCSDDASRREMPSGLATRVLARLNTAQPAPALPWERVTVRFMPWAAGAVALCLFLLNRTPAASVADEQHLAQLIVQGQLAP